MIIFARHGNTFEAGEPTLRVGMRSDLPLTEEGRQQAKRLGTGLAKEGFAPVRIIASPLLRTREFAEFLAHALGGNVIVDDRLRELDYGSWEGLSNAEIMARFGRKSLEEWEKRLVWPIEANWGESEAAVLDRITAFISDAASGPQPLLAVTSNGILRFIRRQIEGALTVGQSKVRTGGACRVSCESGRWNVLSWDEQV